MAVRGWGLWEEGTGPGGRAKQEKATAGNSCLELELTS